MPKKKKTMKKMMPEDVSKKALLVGLNYTGQKKELRGCINDVMRVKECLIEYYGFAEEDITVLTDISPPLVRPTSDNIRAALTSLVKSRASILFFYFNGHGSCLPLAKPYASNNTGVIARIVAADGKHITNNEFREFVDMVPTGCKITIVLDSCHSGGLIEGAKEQIGDSTKTRRRNSRSGPEISNFVQDYPYVSDKDFSFSTQVDVPKKESGEDASPRMKFDLVGAQRQHQGSDEFLEKMPQLVKSTAGPGNRSLPGCGILLSACQSYESAIEACTIKDPNKAHGVFTKAMLTVIQRTNGHVTNRELVRKAKKILKSQKFHQKPGLYCSDRDVSAPFMW